MLILSRHLAAGYEDFCHNPLTLSPAAHLLNVNVKVGRRKNIKLTTPVLKRVSSFQDKSPVVVWIKENWKKGEL